MAEVDLSYRLTEEEWRRTAALRPDADVFPLYDCFFGLVSLKIHGEEVLSEGGFDVSVADVAVGLAEILEALPHTPSGTFQFQQSDDDLRISFLFQPKVVAISHNLTPGRRWECSRDELVEATQRFERSFAAELIRYIPDPFEWRELSLLRRFCDGTGS